MKNKIRIALLAASVAAALGGCAGNMYTQAPYAQFVPERRSATEDTRPAMVMRVDGHMVDATRDDPVSPGVHKVEVSVPGREEVARARLGVDRDHISLRIAHAGWAGHAHLDLVDSG